MQPRALASRMWRHPRGVVRQMRRQHYGAMMPGLRDMMLWGMGVSGVR